MIPRHPHHQTGGRPRTWADAQTVAAGLCRPVDVDAPVRSIEEQSARQLIAALVLAASFTSRPTADAVGSWLSSPGALENTVRPLLEDASYAGGAYRQDARAAVAVLRRADHDPTAAAALVRAALRLLGDETPAGTTGKVTLGAAGAVWSSDLPTIAAAQRRRARGPVGGWGR
jgi:hypothetical protein